MSTKLIVTNYKNFKCGVKLNEGELVNIRFQPNEDVQIGDIYKVCLLYTSPSPRDVEESRMPSSA